MKRKLVLLLCACMLAVGCGKSEAGVEQMTQEVESLVEVETEESEAAPQETQEEAPIREEKPAPEVKLVNLGQEWETEYDAVVLEDAFQRAAYLADKVYDSCRQSILVSPISLDMVLGMAAGGASGDTAAQLYAYLGGEDYGVKAKEYMGQRCGKSNAAVNGYSFQYNIANSIWVNQDMELTKKYQDLMQERFLAMAENVDFAVEREATAKTINTWCNDRTNGLIPEIVKPEMLNGDLAAVLLNTVYFESPWVDKWSIMKHEFTDDKGNTTKQDMLVSRLDYYYENDYATGFAKDYYNGFQFIGILPKAEGDFELSGLDLKGLLESGTSAYSVDALAPKLNYDTTAINIKNILRAQGVKEAFDKENAQFDDMVLLQDGEKVFISDILQRCKIELDENGTKAAAATAAFMENASAVLKPKQVKEVHLDRPFAFMIYDSEKNEIVFLGKVTELK